jgi:hypothetical protein
LSPQLSIPQETDTHELDGNNWYETNFWSRCIVLLLYLRWLSLAPIGSCLTYGLAGRISGVLSVVTVRRETACDRGVHMNYAQKGDYEDDASKRGESLMHYLSIIPFCYFAEWLD